MHVKKTLLIVLFIPYMLYAQTHNYPFIKNDSNKIVDTYNKLYPIFHSLEQLSKNDDITQVSFLQIGDSHIQAGMNTTIIRKRLQDTFGNAGRGYIAPLRLINTNQPDDYTISSSNQWSGSRCVLPKSGYTYGIGGITARTKDSTLAIQLSLSPTDSSNYFNRLLVFHNKANSMSCDSNSFTSSNLSDNVLEINLSKYTNTIQLSQTQNEDTVSIYGFSLENDKKGIRYHSIGVNGAQYTHYAKLSLFQTQTTALHAQLIIISLGTNEAYGRTFDNAVFYSQIDSLISGLQRINPDAQMLLTTPMESLRKYRKKQYINKKVELVRNTILRYAKDKQLPYWDLYKIAGGEKSSWKWKRHDLMRKDGVHFTLTGYELQGNLFFDAFMKSYTNYVEHQF